MSEDDTLYAEAAIGQEVEQFIDSAVGRLILGQAEQDQEQAKRELLDLDPYEHMTLPDLQNVLGRMQSKARIAGMVVQYLQDAITQGRNAEGVLDTAESED